MSPNKTTTFLREAARLPHPDLADCRSSELLTLPELAPRINRAVPSTSRIVAEYGIGFQHFGRIVVHKVAARLLAWDDMQALALFRAGNRTDPRIVRAYEAESIPVPKTSVAA